MNAQKIKNWLTTVFGTVAGVPQIIEGLFSVPKDWGKVLLGAGLLIVGLFTANKKPEAPAVEPAPIAERPRQAGAEV